MEKIVQVIKPTQNVLQSEALNMPKAKRRVAAYARVSTEQEEQANSYEAQIDYYTNYIRKRPDWDFVEVYADEGKSGTIRNVFDEKELNEEAVVANFATTASDGKTYQVNYYNLDVIISVGYRVKSLRGTQFRIWATNIVKEYLKKGFALDDERLKGNGGGNYWKELLNRIRDIRSSEKVLYRQVLDLYATSVDYNPNSSESIKFFKIVQNKLHFAAHGHTAAEVIYTRADADKPFMGLTSFSGEIPIKKDIGIAKNYLAENELKVLNNLVSGYFDFLHAAHS